jgi:hypothetical protein
MNTIRITKNIKYDVERNVFIHNVTGFIINSDSVLIMSFDELSDRMYAMTNTWLNVDEYAKMREFITNVETIYI